MAYCRLKNTSSRYFPLLLTIGVSLGLTIGLFAWMHHWESCQQQAEFDYTSAHFVEAIRRATGTDRTGPRGDPSEFLRFAQRFPRGVFSVLRAAAGSRAVAEGVAMGTER